MSEEEYIEAVAKLSGVELTPMARTKILFYYKLQAPVWQAVQWISEVSGDDSAIS